MMPPRSHTPVVDLDDEPMPMSMPHVVGHGVSRPSVFSTGHQLRNGAPFGFAAAPRTSHDEDEEPEPEEAHHSSEQPRLARGQFGAREVVSSALHIEEVD